MRAFYSLHDRNLTIDDVCALTGYKSHASIYAKLQQGTKQYDPTFPEQFLVGGRRVVWRESAVRAWIAAQEAKKNAAPGQQADMRELAGYRNSLELRELLTSRIKKGLFTTLREAMTVCRLWPDRADDRIKFDKRLDDLSRETFAESGLLLGLLVHEGSHLTPAMVALARELLGPPPIEVQDHVEAIYEAFEPPGPKPEGGLNWLMVCSRGMPNYVRVGRFQGSFGSRGREARRRTQSGSNTGEQRGEQVSATMRRVEYERPRWAIIR